MSMQTTTAGHKTNAHGSIYTRQWAVDLILNLADYCPASNLVDAIAVEPSAGEGAFLVPMVERLVSSCRRQGRPLSDCAGSLLAYELDEASALAARLKVTEKLITLGACREDAEALAGGWIRQDDFLLASGGQTARHVRGAADALPFPAAGVEFVLGNPPYIRLEEIPAQKNSLYRSLYPTMKGRADIYIAFFEAALRHLKPGGVCAFICADRWMLNHYGTELRRLVTSGYGVEAVVEMHGTTPFETDVSAYPAVTVIRRGPQAAAVVARATSGAERAGAVAAAYSIRAFRDGDGGVILPAGIRAYRAATWFSEGEPWPCTSPERLALLKRLERDFKPLESAETGTKVGIGVATGADKVYITLDPGLVEPERLLPLAVTDDTTTGRLRWTGHYLVNPWDEMGLVNLDDYPRLKGYYETHREQIQGRNVAQREGAVWYRTIDRVNCGLTGSRKLYIPDIKGAIHPVLDEGETYPHHNLYFVMSSDWDLEVLGAILLSDVGKFFVECYGVRMRGGYLRMQAQYLRRIRVPEPDAVRPEQVRLLREAFRRYDVRCATEVVLSIYGIESIPNETL